MRAFSLRWLFAIALVLIGAYLLATASGNDAQIATGVACVLAGIGLVAP